MRLRTAPPLAGLALAILAACSPAKEPAHKLGFLYVEGAPDGAYVMIDDARIDLAGRPSTADAGARVVGLSLVEGSRHVSVLATGYFPHDEVVQIREGKPAHLRANLVKLPE